MLCALKLKCNLISGPTLLSFRMSCSPSMPTSMVCPVQSIDDLQVHNHFATLTLLKPPVQFIVCRNLVCRTSWQWRAGGWYDEHLNLRSSVHFDFSNFHESPRRLYDQHGFRAKRMEEWACNQWCVGVDMHRGFPWSTGDFNCLSCSF
jgi:hypothetical protein